MASNKKINCFMTSFRTHCLTGTRRVERERTKFYRPRYCIHYLQGLMIYCDTTVGLSPAWRSAMTMTVCTGLS